MNLQELFGLSWCVLCIYYNCTKFLDFSHNVFTYRWECDTVLFFEIVYESCKHMVKVFPPRCQEWKEDLFHCVIRAVTQQLFARSLVPIASGECIPALADA